MKLPPNFGSITKLKGNRRKPYMVRISDGVVVNFDTKKAYTKRVVLGYYATKKEAMQALVEYNANPYNLDRTRVTIREIWDQIKDKIDVSSNRMKAYESAFRKYITPIADSRIVDVKTAALQDVLDAIPYGYATKAIARTVLNQIYRYAVQNDIIAQNYVQYCKTGKSETQIKRELYTSEEVSALWKESDRPECAMTIILLYEGMRIKELRDMPKNAVDLTAGTFEIREAKNVQSRRIIPIHDRVRPLVEAAMKTNDDFLFGFSRMQYDYFIQTHTDHRPYDTRHTFASKANEIGLPKLTIQRLMGHRPDSILEQAYIHLSLDELREAVNKIEYD